MVKTYLESRILAADPLELIHILYEHAILQLTLARKALREGDIRLRCGTVSKALAILGELEGSLDHRAGGSISHNLADLYQYMRKRLIEGNANQDDAALAEVETLWRTLDEGWTAMQGSISAPVSRPYSQTAGEISGCTWSA